MKDAPTPSLPKYATCKDAFGLHEAVWVPEDIESSASWRMVEETMPWRNNRAGKLGVQLLPGNVNQERGNHQAW